jgi:Zn-dependent protease with chaperone function
VVARPPSGTKVDRKSRLQRWEIAQAGRTFEQVLARGADRPRPGFAGVVLVAISGVLFLLKLGLIVLALVIVVLSDAKLFSLFVVVPLLVAGVVPFVLVARSAGHAVPVGPEDAPELYDFVRRIAAAEGAPMVRRISWDNEFNASASRGFRGHQLTIGMPLWLALRHEERVAMVAHELAHFRNGDPRRGWMVGLAMTQLREWHRALKGVDGVVGLIAAVLALPLLITERVLVRLSFVTSQRAEFHADAVAASVASSAAMIDTLAVTHAWQPTVTGAFQKAARDGVDVWPVLTAAVAAVPAEERDHRLAVATADQEVHSESTHPPTGHRIAVLSRHRADGDPLLRSAVVNGGAWLAGVQGELSHLQRTGRRP